MIDLEALKIRILELEVMASGISISAENVLKNTYICTYRQEEYEPTQYAWHDIPENLEMIRSEAIRNYQVWYLSTYQLVKEYVSEQEENFRKRYDLVLDFISLRNSILTTSNNNTIIKNFKSEFEIQRGIILSIPFVAGIKEQNLRRILTSNFIESEIDQAELLFRNGFERAAGAIAGVALEMHLKALCDLNGVAYTHKDTIEPLAQALSSAQKIELTELKKFIYLGGIRNDCAHPNEVSKDQVRALIEQVKKLSR